MSEQKNYLVAGGTSGIGEAIAQQLNQQSHRVFVAARRASQIPDVTSISWDAASGNPLDLSRLPDQLHGLVYTPGTINLKPFNRLTLAEFTTDFQINVLGAITLTQQVLSRLKNAPQSSILFVSTVAVQQGMPYHASVATAKGGIEGLTRALAAEFAPHIRVNAIAPSLTDTPLAARLLSSEEKVKNAAARHPLKRIGTAQDVAAMALFLLSEQSSWVSGQVLAVDGGLSTLRPA